ncbi:cysteine synthase family protein [bacterium]|nr:cysteine synthase family protein [bacterium]
MIIKQITGNTPLLKISDKIYAKLETYNPAGSIKDRMISYIVRRERIFGKINEKTILCEATSGNTGIALSMISAAMGNPCVIFMPKNMSEERKQMIRVYGAKIVDAPDNDFMGAIAMRDQYLKANENSWSPKQFSNRLNVECHERETALEIHKQVLETNETWSAFIHGAGTGGTMEGMRRYLMKNNMKVKLGLVKPVESPHGIQGIADGKDFLVNSEDMDRILNIKTEDAISRAKQFAKETGLLVGISSGANILASERWVENNNPRGIVVTILCDRGERYMSIY